MRYSKDDIVIIKTPYLRPIWPFLYNHKIALIVHAFGAITIQMAQVAACNMA